MAGELVAHVVKLFVFIPLLALLGSTVNLLLGTTVAQLAFLGLLLETERRFPEVRSAPIEASQDSHHGEPMK